MEQSKANLTQILVYNFLSQDQDGEKKLRFIFLAEISAHGK